VRVVRDSLVVGGTRCGSGLTASKRKQPTSRPMVHFSPNQLAIERSFSNPPPKHCGRVELFARDGSQGNSGAASSRPLRSAIQPCMRSKRFSDGYKWQVSENGRRVSRGPSGRSRRQRSRDTARGSVEHSTSG
jgi:hypothetical protein